MKLNEKIKITEERLNSDERSYERVIMAFLVGSYKATPGYRMEVMSSRETGYETFAVEVSVYMPSKKTAYAAFYIELNSMNIQLAGTQNEPKMIYYRGSFEEYKDNEYKAYCAAADFMARMEQAAPETATPDAPQEAANDEPEANTTDNEQKPAPEFNYDYLSGRYAIFEYADGVFSNEYETDDLKEARERLKDEWEGSMESGAFAIFDRDARQYIQIRATSKGRKAFKEENERLAAKAVTPVNQTESDSAEAGQPAPQEEEANMKNWAEITATAHCAAIYSLDVLQANERDRYGYPLRPDYELYKAIETLSNFCASNGLDYEVTIATVKSLSKHNSPLAWYLPEHADSAAAFLRNCAA